MYINAFNARASTFRKWVLRNGKVSRNQGLISERRSTRSLMRRLKSLQEIIRKGKARAKSSTLATMCLSGALLAEAHCALVDLSGVKKSTRATSLIGCIRRARKNNAL